MFVCNVQLYGKQKYEMLIFELTGVLQYLEMDFKI